MTGMDRNKDAAADSKPTRGLGLELVTLRLMLEDAVLRSRSASRFHVLGVIVALDGVVERTTWFVLHQLGHLPKTTKLGTFGAAASTDGVEPGACNSVGC